MTNTRTVLALDVRAASHRDVIGGLPALTRSLQYPEARPFVKSLASSTMLSPIVASNGVPVAKLDLDLARINATGKRIVRGLHYIEKKKADSPVFTYTDRFKARLGGFRPSSPPSSEAYVASRDQRHREIGKAFSYAVAFFENDRSIWMMMLYGYYFWIASVGDDPPAVDAGVK